MGEGSETARASVSDLPRAVLGEDVLAAVDAQLDTADRVLTEDYPGDRGTRQPVHTVYLPGDVADPDSPARWGAQALALLDAALPDAATAAEVTGLGPLLDDGVYARTRAKLATQPIEDLRVDFEDGYGNRPDAEEDAAAVAAGRAVARRARRRAAARRSPGSASRVWSPPPDGAACAPSTSSLGALLETGPLPDGFVVTLPKVTSADQVAAMAAVCERLEQAHGLPRRPAAVRDPGRDAAGDPRRRRHRDRREDDPCRRRPLHRAALRHLRLQRRLGIAAGYQSMEHPAPTTPRRSCRWPRRGPASGCRDGSTNVLPVGSTASRSAPPGAARAAGAPLPGTRLLPGLGHASRPARDPVPRDVRLLPCRGLGRRPSGCGTTWDASRAG